MVKKIPLDYARALTHNLGMDNTTERTMKLSDLLKRFSDENAAREYLEALRWPNGTVCPHCSVVGEATKLRSMAGSSTRPGVWKCRACRKQFTVTVGSVMEDSHIPLSKWAIAFHLLCASKKGMSAHQLHRMLGIKYESAWFMAHRIRHAMAPSQHEQPDKLRGVVEVDETYIGGKISNRKHHKSKGAGRGPVDKIPVVSLIQRGGKVHSMVMPRVTADNLRKVLRERVSPAARIMTDELGVYQGLEHSFASHESVRHSTKEYVRGDVHVNTAEGFFGILKRGVNGVYHHWSQQHLPRYLAEFDFRYNTRKTDDVDRAEMAIHMSGGKRLTMEPSNARAS
jgi:transposase-like protein